MIWKSLDNGEENLSLFEKIYEKFKPTELTEKIVIDSGQVLNYLKLGNKRRTMGSTGINQFSSRSHAIMEINIEQKINNKNKEEIINSKLLFVDLAGSEKGGMEKV